MSPALPLAKLREAIAVMRERAIPPDEDGDYYLEVRNDYQALRAFEAGARPFCILPRGERHVIGAALSDAPWP